MIKIGGGTRLFGRQARDFDVPVSSITFTIGSLEHRSSASAAIMSGVNAANMSRSSLKKLIYLIQMYEHRVQDLFTSELCSNERRMASVAIYKKIYVFSVFEHVRKSSNVAVFIACEGCFNIFDESNLFAIRGGVYSWDNFPAFLIRKTQIVVFFPFSARVRA